MKAPRWTWILCLAAAVLCLSAASASAADQIYWGNEGGESISHANVAGGGGAGHPDHRRESQPPGRAGDRLRRGQDLLGRPGRNRTTRSGSRTSTAPAAASSTRPALPVVRTPRPRDLPRRRQDLLGQLRRPLHLLREPRRLRAAANSTRPERWSNSRSASPSTPPRTGSTGPTSTAANMTSTSPISTEAEEAGPSTCPRRPTWTCRGRSQSMPRPTASTGPTAAPRPSPS